MIKSLRLLLVPCLFALGCGDGNKFPMVQVTGTITFDGQACPADGNVGFVSIVADPGMPRRSGRGVFGADGKYTAQSFNPGDGLIPGRYTVRVNCLSGPITERMGDRQIRALSYVAPGFKWPELEVKAGGGPIQFDLDVPLKK